MFLHRSKGKSIFKLRKKGENMTLTKIAVKVFRNPKASKLTKILPSGTKVEIFKDGADGLRKVVTQPKMTTISHLTNGGEVTGIRQVTPRGEICYSFGGQNYDRVVEVRPKIGDPFILLGHTGRARSGLLYSNMSGRYGADNKYISQFKQAMDYIRGKNSQYLYSLAKANKPV